MSRFRDEKGRFERNPPTTNPPLRVESLERIEYTTPTGKVTTAQLEEKVKSGQRLALIERQILIAHESKRRNLLETSTVVKSEGSSTKIQQPSPEEILDKSQITMAEEGGGSRGPTPEQLREHERQMEERRRRRENEAKKNNDTLFGGNQNPPEKEESTFKFPIQD